MISLDDFEVANNCTYIDESYSIREKQAFEAKGIIEKKYSSDGYNIGMNY